MTDSASVVAPNAVRTSVVGAQTKVLAFVLLLLVAQQAPPLRDIGYGPVRVLLYSLFAFLIVDVLLRSGPTAFVRGLARPVVRAIALSSLVVIPSALIFGMHEVALLPLDLVIPLGVYVVSAEFRLESRLGYFLAAYVGMMATVAIWIALADNGGFEVAAMYSVVAKNQVGPMMAAAALVCVHGILGFSRPARAGWLLYLLTVPSLAALVLCLLITQNRTGMVAFVVVLSFYVVRFLREKRSRSKMPELVALASIGLLLWVLGELERFGHLVWSAFTGKRDVTDLNSIASGRPEGYAAAFSALLDSPLLGQLSSSVILPQTAHNYALNVLVSLGVLGSLPLLWLYFWLWRFGLRGLMPPVREDSASDGQYRSVRLLAAALLVFSLIVSLFEYAAPYGPGTAMALTWFMLGQASDG